MLLSAYALFVCAITGTFACMQAGRGSVGGTGGEATCSVESSIVIEQRDLQFDHPATSFTAMVKCPCFAKHIHLGCGSDWLQPFVSAANLTVLGDGVCLLCPDQVLAPYTALTFLYLHSPPLLDIHPTDATFFNCTSALQTSSSLRIGTVKKHTRFFPVSLFLTLVLAFTTMFL